MTTYTGDDCMTEIPPNLKVGEKEVVLVVYDEIDGICTISGRPVPRLNWKHRCVRDEGNELLGTRADRRFFGYALGIFHVYEPGPLLALYDAIAKKQPGGYWAVVMSTMEQSRKSHPDCYGQGFRFPWWPDMYWRFTLNNCSVSGSGASAGAGATSCGHEHDAARTYAPVAVRDLIRRYLPSSLADLCPSPFGAEQEMQTASGRHNFSTLLAHSRVPAIIAQDVCTNPGALHALEKTVAHTHSLFMMTSLGDCQQRVAASLAAAINHATTDAMHDA